MKSTRTNGNLGASDYRLESSQRDGPLGERWVVQSKPTGVRHVAELLVPGDDDYLRALCENALRTKRWTNSQAIANVIDAGWLPDGTYFHILEMSPQSRSLSEHTRVSEAELLKMAESLHAGFMQMHKRELVHGLLTPMCIYRDGERALVGDLWWAHNADGQPLYGALKVFFPRRLPEFALSFASPEVLRGQSPKRESDMYSLGAVLFFLLAGEPPRELPPLPGGEDRTSVVAAPLKQLKVMRPDVSDMTCAMIAKLLENDPSVRLSVFSLEAILQELTAEARIAKH